MRSLQRRFKPCKKSNVKAPRHCASSPQILLRIVLPQAARIAAAPLLGFAVQMFQATSLAFALSIPELLSQAYACDRIGDL